MLDRDLLRHKLQAIDDDIHRLRPLAACDAAAFTDDGGKRQDAERLFLEIIEGGAGIGAHFSESLLNRTPQDCRQSLEAMSELGLYHHTLAKKLEHWCVLGDGIRQQEPAQLKKSLAEFLGDANALVVAVTLYLHRH